MSAFPKKGAFTLPGPGKSPCVRVVAQKEPDIARRAQSSASSPLKKLSQLHAQNQIDAGRRLAGAQQALASGYECELTMCICSDAFLLIYPGL